MGTTTMTALWIIMACFMPGGEPMTPVIWTGYHFFFDKEACESALTQIKEKMQPHKAACIYVPFVREYAEVRDHIPRPPSFTEMQKLQDEANKVN